MVTVNCRRYGQAESSFRADARGEAPTPSPSRARASNVIGHLDPRHDPPLRGAKVGVQTTTGPELEPELRAVVAGPLDASAQEPFDARGGRAEERAKRRSRRTPRGPPQGQRDPRARGPTGDRPRLRRGARCPAGFRGWENRPGVGCERPRVRRSSRGPHLRRTEGAACPERCHRYRTPRAWRKSWGPRGYQWESRAAR